MKRLLLLISIISFFQFNAQAANRYWVGATSTSWSNIANWSTSSGGTGGASVPGSFDAAIFDANSLNCQLDIAVTIAGINTSGFTGTLDINGQTFNPSALANNVSFLGGTITDGTSTPLTLNVGGQIIITNTTMDLDIDFTSPRFFLSTSTFNGTASFTKNGGNTDSSVGGNTFNDNVIITNSSAGQIRLANTTGDTFGANLSLINTGSSYIYVGFNGATTVAGNFTVTNSGTSGNAYVFMANQTGSSFSVTGNTLINNTGSSTNGNIYVGNNGTVSFTGTFDLTTNFTGTNSNIFVANGTTSSATFNGATSITNMGSGNTNRIYFGNNGDITTNSTLTLSNQSSAGNSQFYVAHNDDCVASFGGNITIENTTATSDGIFFGNSEGVSSLNSSSSIIIGAGGFVAGDLYFRNFAKGGTAATTLTTTGTSRIYNYSSVWGGDVTFTAPRIYTRSSTYSGDANFHKNGSGNDDSFGGNTFSGNLSIENSGSSRLRMGLLAADNVTLNLSLINSGTSDLGFARTAPGNTVGGDLIIFNTGAGNNNVRVCNGALSALSIGGLTAITNAGTGTTSRVYMGVNGDVSYTGTVAASNTSGAGNSQIYFNQNATSLSTFNETITLENTNSSGDGIYFGSSDGAATLASGKTVQIAAGGFLGGTLTFRNFTQSGTAAMTINTASTANYIALNSQFGGDVTVSSGRIAIGGTSFGGVTTFTKTGTGNDNSIGGNSFAGNTTLTNTSGSQFNMGNGAGDTFSANLTLNNSGTGNMIIAQNSTGNSITGDLTMNNTATGTTCYIYAGNNASSDISIGSNVIINNTGSATTCNVALAQNGTVSVGGNVTIDNDAGNTGNIYLGNAGSVNITGTTTITNSSPTTSNIYLGDDGTSVNTFTGDVSITTSGTITSSRVYVGNNGDCSFGGNLTVSNSAGGGTGSDHRIYMAQGSGSNLSVAGISIIDNSSSAVSANTYIAYNGTASFNGTTTITNTPTGNTATLYIANNSGSSATFGGTSTILNTGSGTTRRVYVATNGTVTTNGTLALGNGSSATNSQMYFANTGGTLNLNENVTLANTNASGDGIYFGNGGGTTILASGKTISISPSFVAGALLFRNFTQLGTVSQSLQPTGTTVMTVRDSEWNGPVAFESPRMYSYGTTYNNTASLTKTGASNDASVGGNIFNGDATITNQGSDNFILSNGTGNDYNGNATFYELSTGTMYPAYRGSSTFAGDISLGGSSTIYVGAQSNGRVIMDGTGAQSINVIASTPEPWFRDLETANSANEITLNTPIIVTTELALGQGNIITTASNLLTMNNNSTITAVSNDAFIDGPIRKIGNQSFTFPTGDNGFYAPISISAPSNNAHHFTAEYFNADPNPSFDRSLTDGSVTSVSDSEYWIVDRTNGTSNVAIAASWNTSRSGVITGAPVCDRRITKWDGSQWYSEGNGGTTGSSSDGNILTGTAEDCATPSFITSWTTGYPITLALSDSYITWDGSVYTGGSGPGGAPSSSDGAKDFIVYGSGALIAADASVNNVTITAAGDITVQNGFTLTAAGSITNDGTFTIEQSGYLVQTTLGASSNSGAGSYTVQQTGAAANYNMWSSPINSATLDGGVFAGANPCDMYLFEGNNQAFKYDFANGYSTTCLGNPVTFGATDVTSGGDNTMDVGRGYFIAGASATDFIGEVNDGDQSESVYITALGDPNGWGGDDWNLLGNPYPSGLDASDFVTANSGAINNVITMWDQANSCYAVWSPSGGVPCGAGATPSGIIEKGQGFFVEANSNSSVSYTNGMRATGSNQFFKTQSTIKKVNALISLVSPTSNQENLMIGFNENATDGLDAFDGHKLPANPNMTFASYLNTEVFVVQGLEPIKWGKNKVVNLKVWTAESGDHTISQMSQENLDHHKVLLRDNLTGTVTDLTKSDYIVSLVANEDYDGRFQLIFDHSLSSSNTDTTNGDISTGVEDLENQDFVVRTIENGFTLINENGINGNIEVYDVAGKVIWNKENVNGSTQVDINISTESTGVYFIRVMNNENISFVIKAIKM